MRTETDNQSARDAALSAIARRVLYLHQIDQRNSEQVSFQSSGAILAALREAWRGGYEQAIADTSGDGA